MEQFVLIGAFCTLCILFAFGTQGIWLLSYYRKARHNRRRTAPELKEFLARKGFDPQMGARPMARLIQDELKKPLAEAILFGALAEKGGDVHVTVHDGKIDLEIDAKVPA